jgi:endonuclease/exonuclease/phosphatase (EEP) superfamily protein YafD
MLPIRDRALLAAKVRRRLIQIASVFTVLSVSSFFGASHWSFELLSHFRVQFAAAAFLLVLLTLFTRQRRVAAMLGVLFLVHMTPLANYLAVLPGGEAHAAPADEDMLPLTVAYHNLANRAADHAAFFDHVNSAMPDVIVLTEMDYTRRADLFHGLRRHWKYFAATPGPSIFNVAVFSRFPLTEASRMLDTSNDWPILHVRICPEKNRQCLRLVTLHAHPPLGRWTAVRDTAMSEAALEAASSEDPVILVGDLNCTPWSPRFGQLLSEGNLRDASRAGLAPTWGSRWPLLGLQIDHILAGPNVEELERKVGPAFGSDHFMLSARLKFAAPRLAPSASAP